MFETIATNLKTLFNTPITNFWGISFLTTVTIITLLIKVFNDN